MKPRYLAWIFRTVLFASLVGLAYLAGRWQETLAVEVHPDPRVRSAASILLAARTTARAKAYTEYLAEKKASEYWYHPAADIDLAKDFKGGVDKLAALPADQRKKDSYEDAFATWAKDPKHSADAATAALALPKGLERDSALDGIAVGWGQTNPKACLDWASSLPEADARIMDAALLVVSNTENENQQPALAAQYVDKLKGAHDEVIGQIAHTWTYDAMMSGNFQELGAALDWLDKAATGTTYDDTVKEIFIDLIERGYTESATFLNKVTEPDVRAELLNEISDMWSENDPQAALKWVQGLPDSDQAARAKAIDNVLQGMAYRDPAAALAFIQNSPDQSQFLHAAGNIAQTMAAIDPQAALAWTNSLPDGNTKNQALNDLLVGLSASNFTDAWNLAANMTDMDTAQAIQTNLLGTLARKDPVQAAALLDKLPTEAVQLKATSAVASKWVWEDIHGFSAWVNGLPPGSQHDAAVAAVLKSLQSSKLPAPERDSLLKSLNAMIAKPPTP